MHVNYNIIYQSITINFYKFRMFTPLTSLHRHRYSRYLFHGKAYFPVGMARHIFLYNPDDRLDVKKFVT
jgi:hypothetical protein